MEKIHNNLPLFVASLEDDNLGIFTISLVDWPAMDKRWEFFSKQEEPLKYSIVSEDEHRVISPIIRANFPILRKTENGEFFYVTFPPETLYEAAKRFLQNGFQGFVKLTHNEDAPFIDGFSLVQWFIKDTSKGISPAGFEDVADGSLFAEYFVTSDSLWSSIKNGTYNGLSMESEFHISQPEDEEITTIDELLKRLGIDE